MIILAFLSNQSAGIYFKFYQIKFRNSPLTIEMLLFKSMEEFENIILS
jgi:hypothetical protein